MAKGGGYGGYRHRQYQVWSEDSPIKGEIRLETAGTQIYDGHSWVMVSDSGSNEVSVDFRPWSQIQAEQEALEAEQEARDTALICIWCGTKCDTAEALEEHEDGCA